MDNQEPQTSIVVTPSKPLPILIIGWLFIIIGILAVILTIFTLGFSAMFFAGFGTPSALVLSILITLVPGVLGIITGAGLRSMKKWSIHLLLLTIAFSVLGLVSRASGGNWSTGFFITPIIMVIIAIYCWNKRHLFS